MKKIIGIAWSCTESCYPIYYVGVLIFLQNKSRRVKHLVGRPRWWWKDTTWGKGTELVDRNATFWAREWCRQDYQWQHNIPTVDFVGKQENTFYTFHVLFRHYIHSLFYRQLSYILH